MRKGCSACSAKKRSRSRARVGYGAALRWVLDGNMYPRRLSDSSTNQRSISRLVGALNPRPISSVGPAQLGQT